MSILELQESLREKVSHIAKSLFNVELGQIAAEIPPKTELGDLAFPVAFELAKQIKQATSEKQNPREIAEKLKAELETDPNVGKVEVAGAGYLNVFFNRAETLSQVIDSPIGQRAATKKEKYCVEHTSVNPNKAAHIGHVRNSVLGDTFVRILRANGQETEVQNYIDNTGVQVADVVVGFIYLRKMNLEQIKELDRSLPAEKPFDYYCWDLYAEVGKAYETDEELKGKRAETLHLIEEGGNETAVLADYVATRNVECIIKTMERLDIRYDLLPRESEILHLKFWHAAFEKMKSLGVIHFEEEGKNKGCWVMPFESHSGTDEHEADKILVRSNGTVTYTGKDIAYQLWKLGELGMDFYYRPFSKYSDGKQVWITTTEKGSGDGVPHFGGGAAVFNVIDTRQSYPQEVVRKGVAAISPEKGEKASIHLSYEMVALSPAAAEELGFKLSDEDKLRTFIEMSGRKGLGVKADDLIDRLEENALKEVESRNEALDEHVKKKIAHVLAVGALRYFLLKFTRNTVIVFDFDDALNPKGETGVFCQYSAARANSILRKLEQGELHGELEAVETLIKNDPSALSEFFETEAGTDSWGLISLSLRLDEALLESQNNAEPAILAKFTFNLAKAFNLFYHNHHILTEADTVKRTGLILAASVAQKSLTSALNTMGIEVPERM